MLLTRAKSLLLMALLGSISISAGALSSDREQPVNITADRMRADEREGLSHYEGDVFLKQGSLEIRAEEITVYLEEGEVTRIIAIGEPAKLQQQPDDREMVYSEARRMKYNTRNGELLLLEDAWVKQSGNRISGKRIHYDTSNSIVTANRDTAPKQSGDSQDDGRVRAIIEPKEKQDAGE
ncbi:lipopolysaccharide transport periplasmic protein LptA [Thiohalophilus thiocyanatoxydans]|uniref:Lipopolysaccharide export system protein LptA n=1 Tax=Thiohalophilus thiocyanatoxydans TaxID=381308 RepID=A0A4R8ITZ6_9GAMM|nr:lipopolysaccharide transport periplasmic protein LptA [Thiohalophilus thiocyanatoxydans]TDY01089.1 lipopolysaccharide export system protein LptA [Thiohalophilus thiocyanatoxydans]